MAASGSLIEEGRQHGVLSFRVAKNRMQRKQAEKIGSQRSRGSHWGDRRAATRHSLLKEQARALQRERTYCGPEDSCNATCSVSF